MAKYFNFVANNLKYYWGDIDLYSEPSQIVGPKRLWIEIFNRALNDLTFQGHRGEYEMIYLKDAYEFFTTDNPIFQTCCNVKGFASDQIQKLREFADLTFKSNYIEPPVKVWKKKGRKPRGYKDETPNNL